MYNDTMLDNARIIAEEFKTEFSLLKEDIKTAYYPMVKNERFYIPKVETFAVPIPGITKVEGLIKFLEDVLLSIERTFGIIGDFFNRIANRAVFDENIRLEELRKLYPIVLNTINDGTVMAIVKNKQVNVVVGLNTEMKKFLPEIGKLLKDLDKNFMEGLKILDKRVSIFMSDANIRTLDVVPKNRDFEKFSKIEKEYLDFIQKNIDPYDLEESNEFVNVFPNIKYLSECIQETLNTGKFIVVKTFNKYKEEIGKIYKRIDSLVTSIKNNKVVASEAAVNALVTDIETIANMISYGTSICFLYIQAINCLIGATYHIKDFKN